MAVSSDLRRDDGIPVRQPVRELRVVLAQRVSLRIHPECYRPRRSRCLAQGCRWVTFFIKCDAHLCLANER